MTQDGTREIISEFQIAGVEGRSIHENVLIANELIDSRLKIKVMYRGELL